MSKSHLHKLLTRELETLNDAIDEKIIRGLPYNREARRHKFLTARLLSERKRSHSLFKRLYEFA